MAIKEKYYNPDRFRSVENLDSLYVRRRRHKPQVIIGNAADIRECTILYRDRIVHNWPSQWRSRYPDGYIVFASRNIYDRSRRTINGEKRFIFRVSPDTNMFFDKHFEKEKIIAALEVATDEELRIIDELCCEGEDGRCPEWWWSRASAEQRIVSQVEAMNLQELRDLAALLEGPAVWGSPNDPSKAA